MEKAIATIDLDNNIGRGELFLRDCSIWCREPNGNEYDTTQGAGSIASDDAAASVIRQCWGLADWRLKFVDA